MSYDVRSRGSWVSSGRYLGLTILAASLALVQLLTLPLLLAPAQLSIATLTFSATQAVLQFGDAGYVNAASNRRLTPLKRRLFRLYGTSISYFFGGAGVLVFAVLGFANIVEDDIAFSLGLGIFTGVALVSSKVRASESMQIGAGRAAVTQSFVWQNIAKPGQLLGSMAGSAVWTSFGGAILAVIVAKPKRVNPLRGLRSLRRYAHYWSAGLGIVGISFGMSWVDTYIIAGRLGLYDAGLYQAVYRPLLGVTYIFLPAIGLIQANLNARRLRRTALIVAVAMAFTVAALSILAVLLTKVGSKLWPTYVFPPDIVAILAVAVAMFASSTIAGTVLLVEGATKAILLCNGLGFVTLASLAWFLIPSYGVYGAALASASGWAMSAISQSFMTARIVRIPRTRPVS